MNSLFQDAMNSSNGNVGITCITAEKNVERLSAGTAITAVHVRLEGCASVFLVEKDPNANYYITEGLSPVGDFVKEVEALSKAKQWHVRVLVARNDLDFRADGTGNTPLCIFIAISLHPITLNMETACALPSPDNPLAFLVYDVWNENGVNHVDLFRRLECEQQARGPAFSTNPANLWRGADVATTSVVQYT